MTFAPRWSQPRPRLVRGRQHRAGLVRTALSAVILVTFAGLVVAAQPAAAEAGNPAEQRMASLIDKRSHNRALGRHVAIAVLDQATNRLVFGRRTTVPMLPASNMKVFTAINALAALGPDHRFTTRTLAGGSPGEVILQGGGDPLLSTKNLKALARQTAAALGPVRTVVLRVDASLFAPPTRAPGWPRGYQPGVAAPVSALARLGDYSMSNQARAVDVFRDALARQGFKVRLGPAVNAPADARVLASIAPHTVRQAVNAMLLWSENNVAEVLYRHVALAKGQPATWAGARQAATAQLAELGIDTRGFFLADGSGLSRVDRVTALGLAQAIRHSRVVEPARFATMYEARGMPTSGVSGTLDDAYGRYSAKPSRCARGDIRAKTGTLFDTIGLTGFTTAADGQEKAFSILVNHRPQRYSPLTTRRAVDGLAATINGCW